MIVGLGGLVTTVAAAYVSPMLASRGADKAWKRDKTAQVYADALVHLQVIEGHPYYSVEMTTLRGNVPAELRPKPDLITANMQLFAPAKVQRAWMYAREADIAYFDIYKQAGEQPGVMNWTDACIIDMLAKIKECRSAIQQDMKML